MKISGYTTSRNALQMDYPIEACIKSMLDFCDEVVVVDSSDASDKTTELLQDLSSANKNLKVYHTDINWKAKNHGIYDGLSKALARKKCTGDYLWQQDLDEVAEEGIRVKLESLIGQASPHMEQLPIIALPVVEYWGSAGKVRIDVNPWKWRISKNLPNITHGIPRPYRKYEDGLLFAKHGCDGCEYIDTNTKNLIQFSNFVTNDVENLRRQAVNDKNAASQYQVWFNMVTEHLPTVYHYSWYSVAAKMLRFKHFWNDSWLSLYNDKKPVGWNPFFSDKSLLDVSDEEIKSYAKEIEEKTGGHIFHTPWPGNTINHVLLERPHPNFITEWRQRIDNEK